jgi:hypothetical protein
VIIKTPLKKMSLAGHDPITHFQFLFIFGTLSPKKLRLRFFNLGCVLNEKFDMRIIAVGFDLGGDIFSAVFHKEDFKFPTAFQYSNKALPCIN